MTFNIIPDHMQRRRSSSGGRRASSSEPISEINVTPMVDVMLVLLIIFMVAAPMLTVGIKVELPKTQAKALTDQKEPLTITLKKNGGIFVQERKTSQKNLIAHLQAVTKNNPDVKIYIRADKELNYGSVMVIMGSLSSNGFTKFAFITDQKKKIKKKQNVKRKK